MTRRQEVVLAALRAEPRTTDQLYERIGYMTLMQVGLIDYRQLRAVLVELEKLGRVTGTPQEDGSTLWTRV